MNHWHIKQAARAIQHGGIVAYPTEAVYGLGCDPLNPHAVVRLLDLKQREMRKGLILIASDFRQLLPYVADISSAMRRKILATWPGPYTWILPASVECPVWIRGMHDSIAVRVTRHPIAASLCQNAGMAIVSTSANISDHKPARNALDIRRIFDQQLDYILHGATGGLNKPTEIRDARTNRVIRSS